VAGVATAAGVVGGAVVDMAVAVVVAVVATKL